MKKKKRRRKDSDTALPTLPEGVTAEDIGRALVGQVEAAKLTTNVARAKRPNKKDSES